MRRYFLYLAITILAFGVGLSVVAVSYLKTEINNDTIEDPDAEFAREFKRSINQIESGNTGYEELSKAHDGDLITVQGFIDEKFLCWDVTGAQTAVCTTVLLGSGSERKSLLIRLQVCDEFKKSNCIVWKPGNRCPDNKLCSEKIRIYDNNSKSVDLIKEIRLDSGGISYYRKNIQLKISGRVTVVENKPRLSTPIEKLEIVEIRQN